MSLDLPPVHDDLAFLAPLSEQRAGVLVDFLAAGAPSTVLDLGCGWGELLLRVVDRVPSTRGRGVDQDESALAHGRELASARGLADRVGFESADIRAMTEPADAVICIGASQVWGDPVETAGPLDYVAALTALRSLLPRGGRLVYGEGIWSRPPTAAATAPLAGRHDEYVDLGTLTRLATDHGFAVLGAGEATLDEWDEFEGGFTAGYARWLLDHPDDHPDADEVRGLAARQRAAYFQGYRGVLGLAYLRLVAL
ncbi:SAM-dependent methyltransferase [Nocardioides cynanchi]|uniref:SAM-dependent methyltransferase n=1 Tax=Nocardioides cynanchi TaxID=2558918 RepID=UPI0012478ACE|nr:methyltransferase domain-containing protein [Nocardioides cynanchi]